MNCSSIRPWILALALAACRNDGDSGPSALAVRSVSVPDFGSWECNRPIEFAFDQRVDFASVSARSIHIRTSLGVPAAGTFGAKPIDANGDGAIERIDERVVVFHPSCPTAGDLSDAGLTPGERYVVTLAGEDSGADPDGLLRSQSGRVLARTVFRAFETIGDLDSTMYDEKPGAPRPVLRPRSSTVATGCYLELAGDPAKRVHFEPVPVFGRPPAGFRAPLNLWGDAATRVAAVLVFDQPIHPSASNLARIHLEFGRTLDERDWSPLETRVELLSNCRPDDVIVRLVPLGPFPPGGFVRARIDAGFQDLLGEASSTPLDDFAITPVMTVAFSSLDPAGAVADELREEFDFGAESPLSFADPNPGQDEAPAQWGQGELRATINFMLPPELADFDWVVHRNRTFQFDTTSTLITGGPDGQPTTVQEARDGLVLVRNFTIESGARLIVRGPKPLVVHATGRVTLRGDIDANGTDAPNLAALSTGPGPGGAGGPGGGAGAQGRAGAAARGESGSSALGAGLGGQGGESGFAPASMGVTGRRGGGGGGGRFALDRGMLAAGDGTDGSDRSTGVESGLSPARGGAAGPSAFTDGDPDNDFLGLQPIVDASGAVVARRRGELRQVLGGAGGGNGGDSIAADSLPLPPVPAIVQEGGGGGGGGGGIVIRALGPIEIAPISRITANGGSGGCRRATDQDPGGACGGSGSGGHVILESAISIDFTSGNPLVSAQPAIQALGGPQVLQLPAQQGSGGAGGPGVVQLHVPHPERAPGDPGSNLILPLGALIRPDPLGAVCKPSPSVLYPTFGGRSTARSRWISLGAAGKGGPARPESVVAFLFDGLVTASGEDEGKVRTEGGRVPELAPLLGPVPVDEPGVELLPDGISLVLAGPILAPLRASAQPISPDVYLRTPALLEGFTLRLANAADPGRRGDFTIAAARYDDASARLTLVLGRTSGLLPEAIAGLGGAGEVELVLVPRFFRVRQGASGFDLLPDPSFVRILFQGAADDGTGRPEEANPLVDWTADLSAFARLSPDALDFVRFRVEFNLGADQGGFDPTEELLVLEFLRLPMRF